jgi:uncharacterized protein YdaU (DUF1376 family)
MALREQPYLPLYIQDFLTDEKLIECSASATGVYIRIMCIMHKSDEYGTILLKQKDKQNSNQIENFALKLAKYLPYKVDVIISGLTELVSEDVLKIDGDKLIQKRMVRDNYISEVRSDAGKEGGKKSSFAKAKAKAKHQAKMQANTEYENEIVFNLYKGVEIFFDEDCRPKTEKAKNEWYDTLDKLIRIDGYSPEHIHDVIKRARMDDFWRQNFLSILKLRKKNKDGIPYFTVFEKKLNNGTKKTIGADPYELAILEANKLGIQH